MAARPDLRRPRRPSGRLPALARRSARLRPGIAPARGLRGAHRSRRASPGTRGSGRRTEAINHTPMRGRGRLLAHARGHGRALLRVPTAAAAVAASAEARPGGSHSGLGAGGRSRRDRQADRHRKDGDRALHHRPYRVSTLVVAPLRDHVPVAAADPAEPGVRRRRARGRAARGVADHRHDLRQRLHST